MIFLFFKLNISVIGMIKIPFQCATRDAEFLQNHHPLRKVFSPSYLVMALVSLPGCFLIFSAVTHFAWWFLTKQAGIEIKSFDSRNRLEFIMAFVLFFLPLLYLFCSLMAKKILTINFSKLALYMGCTFLGAMWYEIILDTLFVKCLGQPGWLYNVWPVHRGYTSGVGMLMWPLYGFFVYCMSEAINVNPKLALINNGIAKTYLFALDAMALEILTNIFSILFFNTYLFYYLPDDLLHFTTIQIFIPYLFASGLGATLSLFLERLQKNHFLIGIASYLAGVISLFFLA